MTSYYYPHLQQGGQQWNQQDGQWQGQPAGGQWQAGQPSRQFHAGPPADQLQTDQPSVQLQAGQFQAAQQNGQWLAGRQNGQWYGEPANPQAWQGGVDQNQYYGAGYGQRYEAPPEIQAQYYGKPAFFDANRGILYDGKIAWFYAPVSASGSGVAPSGTLTGGAPYIQHSNVFTAIENAPTINRIIIGNGTEGNLHDHASQAESVYVGMHPDNKAAWHHAPPIPATRNYAPLSASNTNEPLSASATGGIPIHQNSNVFTAVENTPTVIIIGNGNEGNHRERTSQAESVYVGVAPESQTTWYRAPNSHSIAGGATYGQQTSNYGVEGPSYGQQASGAGNQRGTSQQASGGGTSSDYHLEGLRGLNSAF